jgi:outer membrane receptor protein involved in Fe transport
VRTAARTGSNGAQLRALCIATGVPTSVVDTYTFPTVATSTLSSGNPNLKPESADTQTLGLVFTPQFAMPLFSQVSASIDFYKIKVEDTISAVPAASALNKCYNLDGTNPSYSASTPFCQLISRDSNGLLTQVAAPYLNLGQLKTSGVDVQLDWRFKLGAIGLPDTYGTFGVNTAVSVVNSYQSQALPGDAIQEFKGTVGTVIRPSWQSTTTFRYERGTGSVNLRWRHIPAMKDITSVTRPASPQAGVEKYDIFDLGVRYGLTKNVDLRAGITNLFNRDPALVPGNQNLTIASSYDIIGRAYYVGVRTKF